MTTAEKIDLIKWILGSFVLVLITTILSYKLDDRRQGVVEVEKYDKKDEINYVSIAYNVNKNFSIDSTTKFLIISENEEKEENINNILKVHNHINALLPNEYYIDNQKSDFSDQVAEYYIDEYKKNNKKKSKINQD